MSKGFLFINSLSRQLAVKTPFVTHGVQRHVICARWLHQSSSSISTTNNNTNYVKLFTFSALGIASGVGVGCISWTRSGRRLTHNNALTDEAVDPTTIESGWLPITEEICAKFAERVESGELKQIRTTKDYMDDALFTVSHPVKGAHFEYALFYRESDQRGFAVVQFGPKTQGPPGHVHGGASATVFDSLSGVYMTKGLKKRCVTANLNINYRKPLPLNTTVIAETWLEKVEGRKHYVRCELKSPEGKVYIEGTGLWIAL